MLKKYLFLSLIVASQFLAIAPIEKKGSKVNELSPAKMTVIQSVLGVGAVGVGMSLGKLVSSLILPKNAGTPIRSVIFLAITTIGAVAMIPTTEDINLVAKSYKKHFDNQKQPGDDHA